MSFDGPTEKDYVDIKFTETFCLSMEMYSANMEF